MSAPPGRPTEKVRVVLPRWSDDTDAQASTARCRNRRSTSSPEPRDGIHVSDRCRVQRDRRPGVRRIQHDASGARDQSRRPFAIRRPSVGIAVTQARDGRAVHVPPGDGVVCAGVSIGKQDTMAVAGKRHVPVLVQPGQIPFLRLSGAADDDAVSKVIPCGQPASVPAEIKDGEIRRARKRERRRRSCRLPEPRRFVYDISPALLLEFPERALAANITRVPSCVQAMPSSPQYSPASVRDASGGIHNLHVSAIVVSDSDAP
jgi:hypothetical protein